MEPCESDWIESTQNEIVALFASVSHLGKGHGTHFRSSRSSAGTNPCLGKTSVDLSTRLALVYEASICSGTGMKKARRYKHWLFQSIELQFTLEFCEEGSTLFHSPFYSPSSSGAIVTIQFAFSHCKKFQTQLLEQKQSQMLGNAQFLSVGSCPTTICSCPKIQIPQ